MNSFCFVTLARFVLSLRLFCGRSSASPFVGNCVICAPSVPHFPRIVSCLLVYDFLSRGPVSLAIFENIGNPSKFCLRWCAKAPAGAVQRSAVLKSAMRARVRCARVLFVQE